jgi:hypothetical protein
MKLHLFSPTCPELTRIYKLPGLPDDGLLIRWQLERKQ